MRRNDVLARIARAIAETEPNDAANHGALRALADAFRRDTDIESAIRATDRERRARRRADD